jgi:hypothetical protein
MHEADATYLIKTVFDFFVDREFKGFPTEDECQLSLLCFQDFVKDPEPYWVRVKAQFIIGRLLNFKDDIGDCPATIKEVVLAIVKDARKKLGNAIEQEMRESGTLSLSRDINAPHFMTLNSWARLNWNHSRERQIWHEDD